MTFTEAEDRTAAAKLEEQLRTLPKVSLHDHLDGSLRPGTLVELAAEIGMRPLVAHCHLGLSKLHRICGDRGQAQEHVTKAMAMYREMDMPFWLEQAEAEMRHLE